MCIKEKDDEAQIWLDRIKEDANSNGVEIHTRILLVPTTQSSTVNAIVTYAEENDIDLIVVGTRGRSGLKKVLLGSVASGVVTYSHCPVYGDKVKDLSLFLAPLMQTKDQRKKMQYF